MGLRGFGKLLRFLQQGEVDALEQLPHTGAGLPSELLFDGVESGNDIGDPLLDLLLDDVEAEGVLTVVVSSEDVVVLVLTSEQLEYEHQTADEDLVVEIATWRDN